MRAKQFFSENIKNVLLWAATVLLVVPALAVSIFLRAPQENMLYRATDAPWHVLHTVNSYDGIPKQEHLFLPLVTPDEQARYIRWGGTLPDMNGVYYYMSFPPASFFAAYTFMRVLHLPHTMHSLYIFNSVLYIVSFLLASFFFARLFRRKLHPCLVVLLTAAVYLFSPEVLHSQGVVYWAQSLFQVAFLLQLICFSFFENKWGRRLFYLMCIVAPLVEWTGFLANIGFAVVLLLGRATREQPAWKARWRQVAFVAAATMGAGLLLLLHFLALVNLRAMIMKLTGRVIDRGVAGASIQDLLAGYGASFGYFWLLLAGLLVLVLVLPATRKILCERVKTFWPWLVVTMVPLVENMLLRQHAYIYTYDRMKMVFPLLLLLLLLADSLIEGLGKQKPVKLALSVAAVLLAGVLGGMNLSRYLEVPGYYALGEVSYWDSNQKLADALLERFPRGESLYGMNGAATRGYVNVLFKGGVYEWEPLDRLEVFAEDREKRYVVFLEVEAQNWGIHTFTGALVLDRATGEAYHLYVAQDGSTIVTEPADWQQAREEAIAARAAPPPAAPKGQVRRRACRGR